MAGPKQSKRVSWAPGVTLCQVRLFLSEDAPAQSALGSQDHLQAKVAWLLHSTTAATSDDSVPPGFETLHRGQIQRNIPLIKWHCPPIQCLEPEWLVVAGEESLEVALQDRRQLGVLEAIYPRLSSIPPDPCVSPDVQLALFDDSQTLLIPIVAVEDDDMAEQDTAVPSTVSSYFITPSTAAPEHSLPLPSSMPPVQQLPSAAASSSLGPGASAKPDIAAAASAAFTAIMRSNEEGSLIDRDLLIKILRDPSMVGKLVSEHSARKQTPLPTQPTPPIASGAANTYLMPNLIPTPAPSLKLPPPPSSITIPINIPTPTVLPKVPLAKDVNYYKSLIQKHGGDRQEPAEPAPLPYENCHEYRNKPLESIYGEGAGREMRRSEGRKPRTEKPCAYFNTPRGCRQGSSCSYLHDSSAPRKMERQRGSKRVKFDR